jgi:YfiH family protein
LEWIEPDWPASARVRALSTLRGGGVSGAPFESLNLGGHAGDAPAAVSENRRRLRTAAALPGEPCWLRQVHGRNVADLDADPGGAAAPGGAAPPGGSAAADASFTRQPGRICGILTADCLPLLLRSESGDVVAAAHAGWRGLAAGVIEATVQALKVAPETLMAWLGPAIGPRHFEVGPEVREAMLEGDSGSFVAFVPNARGRLMADLGLLARRRLLALGIRRIYGGGECTFEAEERYFSHRRDGATGRQATLIWQLPR